MKTEEKEAAKIGTDAMAGEDKKGGKTKPKKGELIGFNVRKTHTKGHYNVHHVHRHPEVEGAEQVDSVPHSVQGNEGMMEHMSQHMSDGGPMEGEGGVEGPGPEAA